MPENPMLQYESAGLHTVRPYLIVADADAAIAFYRWVFGATELERHATPAGGVGHAKLRIGDAILEIGEHPTAANRAAEPLPRVGLRHYVPDVDDTMAAVLPRARPGTLPQPTSRRPQRTVHDPFGRTWWLATPTAWD